MSDLNKSSASEDMVRRARSGSDTGVPDFELGEITPPDYSGVTGWDDRSTDKRPARDLSAADIAAELLEVGAISADGGEMEDATPAEEELVAESASLPSWAMGDPGQTVQGSASATSVAQSAEPDADDRPDADLAWAKDVADAAYAEQWDMSTPEWEAYEAARAARKEKSFDFPIPRPRTIAWLAVLAFVGITSVVGIFNGREAIGDLGVGDCFMSGTDVEVFSVPVVDCADDHDAELFARVDASTLGAAYPGEDYLFDWLFEECVEEFPGYVGESYASSPYYVETFIPTSDGWGEGDYIGLCTLVVVNDELETVVVTGSRRGIANNA